eukprot:COSAG06_NODE_2453_length_6854_cov_6.728463_7_plen_81_part_00
MAKAATTAKAGSVAEAVRTMPRLKLYLINSKQASGWCPQSLMWPCYDKNASDIVDASSPPRISQRGTQRRWRRASNRSRK